MMIRTFHATLWLLFLNFHSQTFAQNVQQTFTLHPGWNSVWFEVQPLSPSNLVEDVFSSLPDGSLLSVWSFRARLTSTDFIQDVAEPIWNKDRWLHYHAPGQPEAILNTLASIHANRAYLINIKSSQPIQLTVSGRPKFRQLSWKPNAYTLRGFPVHSPGSASFREYFNFSEAHWDFKTGAPRSILKLGINGIWVPVDSDEIIEQGKAYWIYTNGNSGYQGPFNVSLETVSGINYGYVLPYSNINLQNIGTEELNYSLTDLGSPTAKYFSRYSLDPVLGTKWEPWVNGQAITGRVAKGSRDFIRLSLLRDNMLFSKHETVFELSNGQGIRHLIPVSGQKVGAPDPQNPITQLSNQEDNVQHPRAGLWVGQVSVTHVSEVNSSYTKIIEPRIDDKSKAVFTFDGSNNDFEIVSKIAGVTGDGLLVDFFIDPRSQENSIMLSNGKLSINVSVMTQSNDVIDLLNQDSTFSLNYIARAANGEGTGGEIIYQIGRHKQLETTGGIQGGPAIIEFAGTDNSLQFTLTPPPNGDVTALKELRVQLVGGANLSTADPVVGFTHGNLNNTSPPAVMGNLEIQIHDGKTTLGAVISAIENYSGTGASILHGNLEVETSSPLTQKIYLSGPLTPVDSSIDLRLLIHVDGTGETRILKQVFQMQKPVQTTQNEAGEIEVVEESSYVLITDDDLISEFKGFALKNGRTVARRLSTVGFDFASTPEDEKNTLLLNGILERGNTITGVLQIPFNHPTNPFHHKYHPDHDNLDSSYSKEIQESFNIRRELEFRVAENPGTEERTPDYGYRLLTGEFSETLYGLHKNPIRSAGTFRLERVSTTGKLN